jgi:hypothetical protein
VRFPEAQQESRSAEAAEWSNPELPMYCLRELSDCLTELAGFQPVATPPAHSMEESGKEKSWSEQTSSSLVAWFLEMAWSSIA